jgi:hypothetical protein
MCRYCQQKSNLAWSSIRVRTTWQGRATQRLLSSSQSNTTALSSSQSQSLVIKQLIGVKLVPFRAGKNTTTSQHPETCKVKFLWQGGITIKSIPHDPTGHSPSPAELRQRGYLSLISAVMWYPGQRDDTLQEYPNRDKKAIASGKGPEERQCPLCPRRYA